MLFNRNKYACFSLKKPIVNILLIFSFGLAAHAQNDTLRKDTTRFFIKPIPVTYSTDPIKPNPKLNEHFRSPNNQLMRWPNYPLTAEQIEKRDKNNHKTVGEQVATDVIKSYLKSKKKPAATAPRF